MQLATTAIHADTVQELAARGYRDPGRISRFTNITTVLLVCAYVIGIPFHIIEYNVLSNIQAGIYETEAEMQAAANASDAWQGIIVIVSTLLLWISGISFLIWTYRIVKNAQCISYHPLRFSAGWAIGYYFIPILNLFRPYQALHDAYRVSRKPDNWVAASSYTLLIWWWIIFLLSSFAGRIISRLYLRTEALEQILALNVSHTVTILSLHIPCALLTIIVIRKMCSDQQQAYDQVVNSPPSPGMEATEFAPIPDESTWLIPSRTSGWAIAAGYVGMCAVLLFPAPIALILGIIALRKCKKHSLDGRGRAIFAIVMGLIFSLGLCLFCLLAVASMQ